MQERRFVIDTNLLVSLCIRPGSLPEKMLRAVLEKGRLCFSGETRRELEQVLMRDKFDKYVSREQRLESLEMLFNNAFFLDTISEPVTLCRDPKDDKFLELAFEAKAECLITGDMDLLELHPFRNIPILTASQFLEVYA